MPRGPRLDAPHTIHHLIARGIERRRIFRTDDDRRSCLTRLDRVLLAGGATLYAWCLMPNHVHLLLRTGRTAVGRLMQQWLGAYAAEFNRRHRRVGHLFQNRFKSIVVEEEPYLLELIRYIHLNPVRARMSLPLDMLDTYPWTGHAALLGARPLVAQDVEFVLAQFGARVGAARVAYREFVGAAPAHARRHDLVGGGLRRSAGGWQYRPHAPRGREKWAHDERILGSSEFVRSYLSESAPAAPLAAPDAITRLCQDLAARFDVSVGQIASRSLDRRVLAARAAVCHLAVRRLGLTTAAVARALGISKQSVMRAIDRADEERGIGSSECSDSATRNTRNRVPSFLHVGPVHAPMAKDGIVSTCACRRSPRRRTPRCTGPAWISASGPTSWARHRRAVRAPRRRGWLHVLAGDAGRRRSPGARAASRSTSPPCWCRCTIRCASPSNSPPPRW
ncbi:MAG: transposase [Candidatus Binatia bacterium]